MTSGHLKNDTLISKNQRNDVLEEDMGISIDSNLSTILSISTRDISKPFQGDTRLILSSLGALALGGYEVVHLYLTPNKPREPHIIIVTDGKKKVSIKVIEIFSGVDENSWIGWFKCHKLIDDVTNQLYKKPGAIICERRSIFTLCLRLSKYFKVPLILRIDSLKSFWALKRARYTKNMIPVLKAPFAIASYVLMAKYADYGICVTKVLERKLRRLGIKNVTTIEPTYLTIPEKNTCVSDFKLDLDKDYVIISTKDYKVIKSIASKTPDLRYIIIGETPHKSVIEGLPKNIVWAGIIPDQKLIQLYKNALCTIIYRPWLSGISMTLIETLYYGRPCIINSAALNLMNDEDIEGVLTVDDVSTWLTLLKKFQNDKSFKSLLETAARRFFEKKFSPEVYVTKMTNILNIIKRQY